MISKRPVRACTNLDDPESRPEWNIGSAISRKVAVLKATLITAIGLDTLVSRCWAGSHGEIQIQGAVLDVEDMTFTFADSHSSFQHECPDDIGEEMPATVATKNGYGPRAVGSLEVRGDVPALPDELWLMDSECGHDLIYNKLAAGFEIQALTRQGRLVFSTTSGRIESRNVVPVYCKELIQVVQPYLLRDTPPVLSVGKQCMEQGYTFLWEAGMMPIMTNPEGLVVELEVDRNIPYFRAGSNFAQPREARETKVVPIEPMVGEHQTPEADESVPCMPGQESQNDEREGVDASDRDGARVGASGATGSSQGVEV
jgi:hypothetical protein